MSQYILQNDHRYTNNMIKFYRQKLMNIKYYKCRPGQLKPYNYI